MPAARDTRPFLRRDPFRLSRLLPGCPLRLCPRRLCPRSLPAPPAHAPADRPVVSPPRPTPPARAHRVPVRRPSRRPRRSPCPLYHLEPPVCPRPGSPLDALPGSPLDRSPSATGAPIPLVSTVSLVEASRHLAEPPVSHAPVPTGQSIACDFRPAPPASRKRGRSAPQASARPRRSRPPRRLSRASRPSLARTPRRAGGAPTSAALSCSLSAVSLGGAGARRPGGRRAGPCRLPICLLRQLRAVREGGASGRTWRDLRPHRQPARRLGVPRRRRGRRLPGEGPRPRRRTPRPAARRRRVCYAERVARAQRLCRPRLRGRLGSGGQGVGSRPAFHHPRAGDGLPHAGRQPLLVAVLHRADRPRRLRPRGAVPRPVVGHTGKRAAGRSA